MNLSIPSGRLLQDAQLPTERRFGSREDARSRLIVALDVSDVEEARRRVDLLGDHVVFYKVGLELQFDGGIDFVRLLSARNKKVFLDVKLLDVPNTISKAVHNIVHKIDATYITVHAYRHAISAAVDAKAGIGSERSAKLKILCVTVLTNMDQQDLRIFTDHSTRSLTDLVLERAMIAEELGADGVIASGKEAALIRQRVADNFLIVTPGIRMPGDEHNDQKRVSTPYEALSGGADFIVVGRPILNAKDPVGAAERIIDDMMLV